VVTKKEGVVCEVCIGGTSSELGIFNYSEQMSEVYLKTKNCIFYLVPEVFKARVVYLLELYL